MKRMLAAAALAAATLSAASVEAAAAPVTFLSKTYDLQCQTNASDGTALKVRTMVKNTTGRIIKKGTPIAIRYSIGYGPYWTRARPRNVSQIAYRDVAVNDSIGFDQPRGMLRCRASVTLRQELQTKIQRPH